METAPRNEVQESNLETEVQLSHPVPPPRRSWAWLGIAGWVAAAAMAVAVGTFWETILRLRHEIQMRDERVADLALRTERDQRWTAMLGAPGVRAVELRPTALARTALRGRAIYDPGSQRALILFQEALSPPGQEYRLWAIRGGIAMDLGLLRPDSSGSAIFRLENMGAPGITEGLSVTLESREGPANRSSPAGPVVLQGPLQG
jgi:hypothetical protein